VRYARIAEVYVRVDQAGQDVQTTGIDRLPAVRQRVIGADRHNPAFCDGNAALQRAFRGDDRSVLHHQICFHDILLLMFAGRSLLTAR